MFETIRDKNLKVHGGTSLHDLNQQ